MGLNNESYLDDLLKAVTAEDNSKKEQTPLEELEGSESGESSESSDNAIENSDDLLQNGIEEDQEFSSDDLTQMLQDLEQIEDEPLEEEAFEDVFNEGEESEPTEPQLESAEGIQTESNDNMQTESAEDYDMADLLSSMGEDEELAEVNELLQKDENHEVVEDDDILELLERASQAEEMEEKQTKSLEETSNMLKDEEKPAAKKKRRWGKNKKKKEADSENTPENIDAQDTSEGSGLSDTSEFNDLQDISELLDNPENKNIENKKPEKKIGFIKKLFDSFFETDDDLEIEISPKDDETSNEENKSEATGDNLEVLKELEAEDKNKKEKKKGKGKGKEKEKGKGESKEKGEGEEETSEDGKKARKGKKPKKEKAPREATEQTGPEKKLSRKKVIIIALFHLSMLAAILIFVIFIPKTMLLTDANKAFGNKDYKETYKMLSGMKLGNDESEIYKKTAIVLELQRKYEAFENYQILNMEIDALNALLQGIVRYDRLLPLAEEAQVAGELVPVYEQIIAALDATYGLSEADAREIIAYDRVTYTKKIESMINGTEFVDPNVPVEEPIVLDDMLPEEMEMLNPDSQGEVPADGMQSTEDATAAQGGSEGATEAEAGQNDTEGAAATEASQGGAENVPGAEVNQNGAQEGTNGKVLYSGTIKDGEVILHE